MGRRKLGSPPPYLLDRSTRQAYATVAGHKTFFGAHGTEASRYRYQRFLRTWERTHGAVITADAGPDDGTIRTAMAAYLAEIRGHLSTKEYADTKRSLDTLVETFGLLEPDDFRPDLYRQLRDGWLGKGHHRRTISKQCGHVKRFFRWCVSEQRAEPQTHAMLLAVLPLPAGRAPENPPIEEVPLHDYLRTIRKLGRHIRAMCRLQFWAGPRPGEVCRLRGRELHRSGTVQVGNRKLKVPDGVWLFLPGEHKKKHRRKATVYVLGPRAQAAIRPFLRDDQDAYLFNPKEARAEWEAAKRAARRSRVQPSQADRSKRRPLLIPGACYTVSSYGRAIERACERAGVPHWNPHRIRRMFAGRAERMTDLLTASAMLSHESPDVSTLYVQRKIREAAAAARRIG